MEEQKENHPGYRPPATWWDKVLDHAVHGTWLPYWAILAVMGLALGWWKT